MNRNQLKYFVAAAESRSFTKAAEQFYISQTAITQQIRLLEETLGCPLFDRSTRPVSLTPAGTIFLREAKGILERMSRAQERVHDASTGLSGTLRVGYVRGTSAATCPPISANFTSRTATCSSPFTAAPPTRWRRGCCTMNMTSFSPGTVPT
ncbi:MAG: LysR family transcriptional regulator [Dysosmobacter sp.]